MLPGAPSDESNMNDARRLAAELGVELTDIDIQPIVEQFSDRTPYEISIEALGNLRARTRMVLFYVEANVFDHLVIGCTNRSELLLGYFTKFGDGAADVRPLAGIYKTEIPALAQSIGVDEWFIQKTPTDELWEGQTDEGDLGATYETIDTVLGVLVEEQGTIGEAAARAGVGIEEARRLQRMMDGTVHKRESTSSPDIQR